MTQIDLLIVGAGPAGMTAAIAARRHGLIVTVIDDQAAPGGQIWRSVEAATARYDILGPTYSDGLTTAEVFRQSGAQYLPGAQLWQLEDGFRAYITQGEDAKIIETRSVILATGAQERPAPFPGWTLPGVMTVGAAQLLLKNAGQIPANPVWIAGCGPLPLLYATQLLAAGGEIAGFLDTTPPGQWRSALKYFPKALKAWRDILKGAAWSINVRRKTKVLGGVVELKALGKDKLEAVCFSTQGKPAKTAEASVLLVHEGVIPGIHPTLSLGCDVNWSADQESFYPKTDEWGETSRSGIFIAGDGAGIAGAKAAVCRGELAALRVACKLGRIVDAELKIYAALPARKLKRELAVRPFLDAMYRPRDAIFNPSDETIVCRCEEVSARRVREAIATGSQGPNQVKTATRIGMGPCQGRQCGYTITRMLSEAKNQSPSEIGFLNIRPPLKPLTLGELATLDESETELSNGPVA